VTIAVVDYGMGNLLSVAKAIERVAPGVDVMVTSRPDEVDAAERVVFPGQGRCLIACARCASRDWKTRYGALPQGPSLCWRSAWGEADAV